MRRTVLLSSVISSVMSVVVTVSVIHLAIPSIVEAQQDVMRAQGYVLVGSDGLELARLLPRTNPRTGDVSAVFVLAQGDVVRTVLGYGGRGPEGAALALRDSSGGPQILLQLATGPEATLSEGDLNRLAILDREHRIRVHIGVDGAGSPFIQLLGEDGGVLWQAP